MDEDRNRADVPSTGASAPEPSLVARQARASVGAGNDLTEQPAGDPPPSTDRVDARAATIGTVDPARDAPAEPGDDTATPAATTDHDPLARA